MSEISEIDVEYVKNYTLAPNLPNMGIKEEHKSSSELHLLN